MPPARSPITRGRAQLTRARARRVGVVGLLVALAASGARAQAVDTNTEPPCEQADRACLCEREACWDFDFLSAGRTSTLGLTTTLTSIAVADAASEVDAAVLASYRAEAYRSHGLLNSHVVVSGAIGAGSAGTEGWLGGAIDFGVRAPISRVSGPVLRLGPTGLLLGNEALQLALIEPARISAAYQLLVSDTLLESGFSAALIGSGRFAAAEGATNLTGALEIGHYLAVQVQAFRFDGRVLFVRPSPFGGARLGALQLEGCALPRPVAFCLDARYIRAVVSSSLGRAGRALPAASAGALYATLTVGLTP